MSRSQSRQTSLFLMTLTVAVIATGVRAQQALVQGERVVSVGRIIPSKIDIKRPCTKDCEKQATKSSPQDVTVTSSKNAGQSVLNAPSQPEGLDAPEPTTNQQPATPTVSDQQIASQLRELKSRHVHELKQATERIDRLTQALDQAQLQLKKAAAPATEESNNEELIAQHKEALAQKDQQIKEIASQLTEKQAGELAERDKLIADKEKQINEMTALAEQLKQQLVESKAITSKEQAKLADEAKARAAASAAQAEMAAKLNEELTKAKEQLKKMESIAKTEETAEAIAARDGQIKELSVVASKLEDELMAMQLAYTKENKQRNSDIEQLKKRIDVASKQAEEAKRLGAELAAVKQRLLKATELNKKYADEIAELKRKVETDKEKSPSDRVPKKRGKKSVRNGSSR